MAYDINKALERLENNLKDISSAKEQVESIITCNEDLKDIFLDYVKCLESFNLEVKKWIDELNNFQKSKTSDFTQKLQSLQNSLNTTKKDFSDTVASLTNQFDNTVNGTLTKFVAENEELHKEIENLKPVTTTTDSVLKETKEAVSVVNQISKNLDAANSNNSKAIKEIRSSLETISSELETRIKEIENTMCIKIDSLISEGKEMNRLLANIGCTINTISDNVNKQKSKIDELNKSLVNVGSTINITSTNVNKQNEKLDEFRESLISLNSDVEKIKKDVVFNRIILIMCLLISVALMFIR